MISGNIVWAQDLCAEAAVDITGEVTLESHRVVLDGRLISQIGLSGATPGDVSFPGLVIQVRS